MSFAKYLRRKKKLESETQIRKRGKLVGVIKVCPTCKVQTAHRKLTRDNYECIPCSKSRDTARIALETTQPSSDSSPKGEGD